MKRLLASFCIVMSFILVGCGTNQPLKGGDASLKRNAVESNELQFSSIQAGDTLTTIHTTMGDIVVVLYPTLAPQAVTNFTQLAQQGYYDNTIFHRVVADFIVQAGAPSNTGEGGQSIWGAPFPTEANNQLYHYSGALCMAVPDGQRSGAQSQFYIVSTPQGNLSESDIAAMEAAGYRPEVIEAYKQAGGVPSLDLGDTVFGQVVKGMEVVDKIAAAKTDKDSKPKSDITVTSISFTVYEEPSSTTPSSVISSEASGSGTAAPQSAA